MLHQVVHVPEEIVYKIKVAGSDAKEILTWPGMVFPVGFAMIDVMKSEISSELESVVDMYKALAFSWLTASFSLKFPEPGSVASVAEL